MVRILQELHSRAQAHTVSRVSNQLREGAAGLGLALTAAQERALLAHLDLLDVWGARMNLTAIRDREQQITRHVLDSLSVLPWVRGERVADLGSGAGFPGIPLAIVDPGRHYVLIESTGKKCRFLSEVVRELGLGNVEVVQARSDHWRPPAHVRFGTVLARAVGSIADLVRSGGHLVAGGGRLLAMKGRLPEAELAARLNGWKVTGVHRLAVPGLDEERHLVELCHSHQRAPIKK
jgi:16S rRNA (guanine527-N7)-methyltransferase